jgi:hypothetical protein
MIVLIGFSLFHFEGYGKQSKYFSRMQMVLTVVYDTQNCWVLDVVHRKEF